MRIDIFASLFVNGQTSPETRRAYNRDIQLWFEFANENGIDATFPEQEDATSFRDYLVSEFAANSAVRTWTTVRGLYRAWEARRDYFGNNPFPLVKSPKRIANAAPRVPSDEAVDLLVYKARDHARDSLVIALLLNGLRASEVGRLKKDDVEVHQGAIVLRLIGKGEKERLIPANHETQRALTRWEHESRNSHSEWLIANYGQRMNYRAVEHTIYKYAVEDLHPHALRHHYATRLIRAGVSVMHVQRLLGHANVETTQAYVTLDLRDLINASRMDPRNLEGGGA